MSGLEAAFRVANFGAVIAWILLAASAVFGWRGTARRFCGAVVPVLLACAYVAVLVTHWGGSGDFGSLAGVGALFRQPAALLAGWLHYLAFDLLVGVAIVERCLEERMPRLLLVPVLPLTFLFGPAGWLLFQGICLARRGQGAVAAAPALPPRAARRRRG